MPFQTTSIVPPTNPKVTITFSGLMVLRPGPNNTCEVGIHRFTTSHECHVMLITRKPNRPPTLLPLLKGPLTAPFTISHIPDPNPLGGDFKVFAPTPEPFVRNAKGNHVLDHRWAVNLSELHPNVPLNDGAQPLVTLKTGILYTPNLTRTELSPRLELPDLTNIQLHRLASNLAVATITPDSRQVLLEWRDLGDPSDLLLPRDGDPPSTTYTVSFINDPPRLNAEPHDEMLLYYRILDQSVIRIGSNQQYSLIYDTSQTRTDEIPCLSLIQNP